MKRPIILIVRYLAALIAATASHGQTPHAEPIPTPKYTIILGSRDACVAPHTHHLARADGGIIDVQTPSPSTITVSMTGTPASESYLCCTSTATQTFHLVQDFEITCSDPATTQVELTIDSSLTGFLRSAHRAGAYVRLACVSVVPVSKTGLPLVLEHPPFCASGTEGRLCNQHLPVVQGPPMPLGRYLLTADFVLDTTASGICNAHAVADFSPDTALPADWVRTRDPFQGVSKKTFGFIINLSAASPAEYHSAGITPAPAAVTRTSSRPPAPAARLAQSYEGKLTKAALGR
jgi:hypothetical protein